MIYDTSLDVIQGKVVDGARISSEEAVRLYHGLTLPELGALADVVRERKHPERTVTYIIDRNINYTNVCDVYCTFCAFMREEREDDSYVLTPEQVGAKIQELVAIGGVQILMQGGHHPKLGIDYYLNLLQYIRRNFPQVNIHGFSPPEFNHFAGGVPDAAGRSDSSFQGGGARIDSRRRGRDSGGPRPPAHFPAQVHERRMAARDGDRPRDGAEFIGDDDVRARRDD